MMIRTMRLVIFSVGVAVLTGCFGSPAINYYTLTAGGPQESAAPAAGGAAYSIAVGPVTLPEVVDRPQLVVRVGGNQVVLVDEHRWAEPLSSEIPRAIAGHLAQLLGTRQVSAYPSSASDEADYRVFIDIQRFDSELREAVTIDAIWTIRRPAQKDAPEKTGRSLVREAVGGNGYEALVSAHSRALAALSRDIAAAIRATDSAGAKTAPTPSPPPATPAPPASAPAP